MGTRNRSTIVDYYRSKEMRPRSAAITINSYRSKSTPRPSVDLGKLDSENPIASNRYTLHITAKTALRRKDTAPNAKQRSWSYTRRS